MPARLLRAEERFLATVAQRRAATDPAVNRRIALFSSAGEYGRAWFAVGAVGLVVDPGRRRGWWRAVAHVVAAYGMGLALKNLIRRPRPTPADGPALVTTPTQLSFPSSHATTSFAAAAAFAPLVRRRFGGLAAGALTPLAAAMSASRVYLGVHYPSDVAAGALLGTVVGRFRR